MLKAAISAAEMVEIKYLQPPREGLGRGQGPPLPTLTPRSGSPGKGAQRTETDEDEPRPRPILIWAQNKEGRSLQTPSVLSPLHPWPMVTNQPSHQTAISPTFRPGSAQIQRTSTAPGRHWRPAQPGPPSALISRCCQHGTLPCFCPTSRPLSDQEP